MSWEEFKNTTLEPDTKCPSDIWTDTTQQPFSCDVQGLFTSGMIANASVKIFTYLKQKIELNIRCITTFLFMYNRKYLLYFSYLMFTDAVGPPWVGPPTGSAIMNHHVSTAAQKRQGMRVKREGYNPQLQR